MDFILVSTMVSNMFFLVEEGWRDRVLLLSMGRLELRTMPLTDRRDWLLLLVWRAPHLLLLDLLTFLLLFLRVMLPEGLEGGE